MDNLYGITFSLPHFIQKLLHDSYLAFLSFKLFNFKTSFYFDLILIYSKFFWADFDELPLELGVLTTTVWLSGSSLVILMVVRYFFLFSVFKEKFCFQFAIPNNPLFVHCICCTMEEGLSTLIKILVQYVQFHIHSISVVLASLHTPSFLALIFEKFFNVFIFFKNFI